MSANSEPHDTLCGAMHHLGWTFESNGHGAMFFWRPGEDPRQHLIATLDGQVHLHADPTPDVVAALVALRTFQRAVEARS